MQGTGNVPLWRNRDYMLLWSGQAVSLVGYAVQNITLPLLILAVTHSAAQAGIAAALETLSFAFLTLPAGVLVDRWNRKRVMIVCDAGRAIATGSIPLALWLGYFSIVHIYLVALATGVFATFFTLAETASLPNVVSKEQLPAALGQNYASTSGAWLVGPPLGGLLFAVSHALPFLVNAVSFVVSILSLQFVRVEFQQERKTSSLALHHEILEGLRLVWHQPLIRFLALRNGAANIVYGGTALILIVLAAQLHASAFVIGIIFAIDSIGGIIASLLVDRIQRRLSFAAITLGFVWLTALLFPLYLIAPNGIFLGVIAAILSFAQVIFDVAQLSYRATLIPDALFGRVTSSIRLFTVGAMSLGAALVGVLLQTAGTTFTVLTCTALLFLIALATSVNRSVRATASQASI